MAGLPSPLKSVLSQFSESWRMEKRNKELKRETRNGKEKQEMEKRNKDLRSVGRMQYKNSCTNCRLDAFFLCPKREGHMSGSTPSRSSSRASLSHRLKSMLFSEVPREIAICEFDCPRNQCTHGEWATCQRRIQLEALCHPKQADGAPGASCPNPSVQIAYRPQAQGANGDVSHTSKPLGP